VDIRSASLSDQGRRKNNEDFAAYFEPTDPAELQNYGCLYIVADGVGGAAKGERASQFTAQKVLFDYYQPFDSDPDLHDQSALIEPLGYLRAILHRVNEEIYDYAFQNEMRMATTIVAAVVREGFLYIANVGDSRAYLTREGVAKQINRDHSLVGELVEHGEMTESEAMASSIKNRLTRSLGGDPDVVVDTYEPLRLQNGDTILLCTDGLTRYASKEVIANMTSTGTPEEIAHRCVEFANDSGGADNISAVVIAYQPAWAASELSTIPIPRPQDVDLDTLTPVVYANYKKNIFTKDFILQIFQEFIRSLSKNRKWQAATAMTLTVFALVVVAGTATLMATAKKMQTVAVALSPTQPSATMTFIVPASVMEPSPLPPTEPRLATSPPNKDAVCVYQVKPKDNMSVILLKFPNNTGAPSYCTSNELPKCRWDALNDPNHIQAGWWIMIQGVESQSICENSEGTWCVTCNQ